MECNQLGVESTRCNFDLRTDDDPKNFCASWACVETDHDGTQQFKEYKCVKALPPAVLCQVLAGALEVSGEVDVSACECIEERHGAGVSPYTGNAMGGISRNKTTPTSVGVILVFISGLAAPSAHWRRWWLLWHLWQCQPKRVFCWVICFLLQWDSPWTRNAIIWGGHHGAVYVAVRWGSVIAGGLSCRYLDISIDRLTINRCLATNRDRATQSSDKLDQPILNNRGCLGYVQHVLHVGSINQSQTMALLPVGHGIHILYNKRTEEPSIKGDVRIVPSFG